MGRKRRVGETVTRVFKKESRSESRGEKKEKWGERAVLKQRREETLWAGEQGLCRYYRRREKGAAAPDKGPFFEAKKRPAFLLKKRGEAKPLLYISGQKEGRPAFFHSTAGGKVPPSRP